MVDNDGNSNGKCSLKGVLGAGITDTLINPWLSKGNNCTLIKNDSYGSFITEDGLKGLMLRNEVDHIPILQQMHETDLVDYNIPMAEDKLMIVCAYNYTNATIEGDLIDSYLSFNWTYYLAIMLSFIIFTASWNIFSILGSKICDILEYRIKNSYKPCYWITLCSILEQYQYPNVLKLSFLCLSICSTMLFYIFINCFMLGMIQTDLVVITEPQVVRDYRDIISRSEVKVLFFKGTPEEQFFEHAKDGTDEFKLWQKKQHLKTVSADSVFELIDPAFQQKVVIIARQWTVDIIIHTIHPYGEQKGYLNAKYLTTFDHGKSFTNGYVMRKGVDNHIKYFFDKLSLKLSESGLISDTSRILEAIVGKILEEVKLKYHQLL